MTGFVTQETREMIAEVLNGGVIYGDPFTYIDGVTAKALRSGVDGPHAGLADRVCNINGRLYE